MTAQRSHVPCNGCTACCKNEVLVLEPENGDDVDSYEHETVPHPITGEPAIALKRQANGDCVYLGPTGCTIHERAPAQCREFDCRELFVSFTRKERRQIERVNGQKARDIFAAGRQRLPAR
jgi:uncharacterized protein